MATSQIGKYGPDLSSAPKALSYSVKTAKIGPVDPKIFDKIHKFFGGVVPPDVHI